MTQMIEDSASWYRLSCTQEVGVPMRLISPPIYRNDNVSMVIGRTAYDQTAVIVPGGRGPKLFRRHLTYNPPQNGEVLPSQSASTMISLFPPGGAQGNVKHDCTSLPTS